MGVGEEETGRKLRRSFAKTKKECEVWLLGNSKERSEDKDKDDGAWLLDILGEPLFKQRWMMRLGC